MNEEDSDYDSEKERNKEIKKSLTPMINKEYDDTDFKVPRSPQLDKEYSTPRFSFKDNIKRQQTSKKPPINKNRYQTYSKSMEK